MYKESTPRTIYLKDYKKPDYTITHTHLTFTLDPKRTLVQAKLTVKALNDKNLPLILDGEGLEFKSLKVNGDDLAEGQFQINEDSLEIKSLPKDETFSVEIENYINPEDNKALEGLYISGNIFCTQNEPEGFRRITYFLDRPDVMSLYVTRIIGDKEKCPILLSNGNPIDSGDLDNGQHFVTWEDPFPKPSYLYALVAGDLGLVQDEYTTGMTKRKIDLRIYCDRGNEDKCDHAMESLKKSMKWDEDKFGLEYDLDIYMIVAVDAFNMGAMENKGLNIFNSSCVLANPKMATDSAFKRIESIISHEYFHNWTGNRITCRDWFQLTLKEGLTVFRDQEFSADMNSRVIQRIEDVQGLKQGQFVEDAGPMSHPIKPSSYVEINNFYTATIYEKGAEVIRMIHTFLGEDGFRKGMDKYFELYDGQAITTEDFLHAMSSANGIDLSQFENWYHQAGTPDLQVSWDHDKEKETLTFKFSQRTRPTPGQQVKKPFHFPFVMGLLDGEGKELSLNLHKENYAYGDDIKKGILHITQEDEEFTFTGVKDCPTPSLNRSFLAPIKVHATLENKDHAFLMAYDSDSFNRYESSQELGLNIIQTIQDQIKVGTEKIHLPEEYKKPFKAVLEDKNLGPEIKAKLIEIPSYEIIFQGQTVLDIDNTLKARKLFRELIGKEFKGTLLEIYKELSTNGEYTLDPLAIGKRELKGKALGFLMETGDPEIEKICWNLFQGSNNMTDELGSLALLAHYSEDYGEKALNQFFEKWKSETIVMEKWFQIQGSSPRPGTLEKVKELESNPVYDKTIPNLVRALIGSYCSNYKHFHKEGGEGYRYLADKLLEIDALNPQMGSRLASAFKAFKLLPPDKKALMEKELDRVLYSSSLSKNVFEIISKIRH